MPRSSQLTPTRALLLLAGALALHACALPPAPIAGRPLLRSFCTIRLGVNEEILIAPISGRDTTSRSLANVLEVGGRVSAIVGDTLVVEPYYLTTRPTTDGGLPITIYRGREALPDLVLVSLRPNISIREFHTPGTARRGLTVPLVLGGLFLLTLLAADVSLLLSL